MDKLKEKAQKDLEGTSIRSTIYDLVSSIVPYDSQEEEHIQFTKNWILSDAEIFRVEKPATPPIHLVSYFLVIDSKTNQFLLVDHKKACRWLPPGGHVEVNEHPQETVKREIMEELGIEAQFLFEDPLFLTVTGTFGAIPHTDVSLWYVLKSPIMCDLKYDAEEFHEIQWFNRENIPFANADPHLERFLNKIDHKITTLQSYETTALSYAKNTEAFHPQLEAQKFLNRLPANGTVLDIGCGPGRDAKIFSDLNFNVIGIDFSASMIKLAKENAPLCTFHVMDMEELDFPNDSFDGIWANCSLLHISKKNMPFVLKKIYAILKFNGVFYLSVKEGDRDEALTADSRYEGVKKYWSYYQQNELLALLHSAGFQILDISIQHPDSDYHTHSILQIFVGK